MRRLGRRDAPPAAVVAELPPGERVVSWADAADGSVVLASPAGLWWPDADGRRLIGWHHIDKATWRDGTLTVVEADIVDDLLLVDRAPVAVELTVPRDLPPVVRKRIEANVVRSEVRPVLGGSVRLVGRRVPGEDGVRWWARLEGAARDSEAVRSAVGAELALLAAEHESRFADQ